MQKNIYLAIDIGASSGRHIAAWRDDSGQMQLKEVYRFENHPDERDGHLIWDLDRLCDEVVNGLCACKRAGITPVSVGIDTWAVDYVLLDEHDAPIAPLYCYRDARGAKAAEQVHAILPFADLYAHTGIQFQPFNTIYQLYDDKLSGRLERAADFLMLPEYLSFYLSGTKAHEYTNASSTGLLDARTGRWDGEIIDALGLPRTLFASEPQRPPFALGSLRAQIAERVGFDCTVVLPATHDTASAVAALPRADGAFLSSGTWSLLGAQLAAPVTNDAARASNFTNEGGVGTIRFLKNIMGLWLVQCLKREYDDAYSFAQLAQLAREAADFDYHLDVNDDRYLAPVSVRDVIAGECARRGFPVPTTPGQFAHAIYSSLAHAYAQAIDALESVTGQRFETLCIVGGGVQNTYLNELTQRATGRQVITGSPEATALGNVLIQEAYYVS